MSIPRYATKEGPLTEQRLYLWMDIRAKLRPDEGTVLNFLSSERDANFPPLQLTNSRVEEILDKLVSRPPYAAWILHPIEPDLQATAADPEFVTFFPYPDGTLKLRQVSCQSPKGLAK